jgi:putative PIN family toxin of toxin-antitoxin system
MKVVFDTNVFIAAVITEGICSRVLHRARQREFSLISCKFIIEEINGKLLKKFRLSREEAGHVMEIISDAVTEIIEYDLKIEKTCRDADDDNILACAVAARAHYIVTGDDDLLVIKRFRGISILTPRDFEALFVY